MYLKGDEVYKEYFDIVGGFPPNRNLYEVSEYKGEEKIAVVCTQLYMDHNNNVYSEKDRKRIFKEWLQFFETYNPNLKAVHFLSRVPQTLFNAVCCQKDLEELRFKWGRYSDLSELKKLTKLKCLYIGNGAGIKDISVLGELKSLAVLELRGLRGVEDYSALAGLENLEQLTISGPSYGTTPIKDLDFVQKMPNLRALFLNFVSIKKKFQGTIIDEMEKIAPNLYVDRTFWNKVTE